MTELLTKQDLLVIKQDLLATEQKLQAAMDTLALRLTVQLGASWSQVWVLWLF
jgi:hypothetical protein